MLDDAASDKTAFGIATPAAISLGTKCRTQLWFESELSEIDSLSLSWPRPSSLSQPRPANIAYKGPNMGYPGDCSYSTYAQCQASASGTIDDCGINPRYAYARQGGYSNRRTRRYWVTET
jgi:hypothetical protein